MRKHYGRLSFPAAIEPDTTFRLLTRLQTLPIVAALHSVGEFSRAFSKTFDEKQFAKSIVIREDKWGEACLTQRP